MSTTEIAFCIYKHWRDIRMRTRRGLTILALFRSFIFSPSPPAYVYKKSFWEGEIIAVVRNVAAEATVVTRMVKRRRDNAHYCCCELHYRSYFLKKFLIIITTLTSTLHRVSYLFENCIEHRWLCKVFWRTEWNKISTTLKNNP